MKKIFTMFVIGIFLLSFMSVGVLAQASTSAVASSDSNSGVFGEDSGLNINEIQSTEMTETDSNGIFGLKVRKFFAFKKVEKEKIARRIREKETIEDEKNLEEHPERVKAKKIAGHYEERFNALLDELNGAAESDDKKVVIHALRKSIVVKARLEAHKERIARKQEEIFQKKSEQGWSQEKLDHLTEVFNAINEKIDNAIIKVEAAQEDLKAKLIALGVEESVIDRRVEKFEASLEHKKRERKDHMKELKEKIKEHRAEIENEIASESRKHIAENDNKDGPSNDNQDLNGDAEDDSSNDSQDSSDDLTGDLIALN